MMKNSIEKIISETVNKYIANIINEKTTLNRILTKHGNEGYIIISGNRGNLSPEENEANRISLLNDIKKANYNYTESYGGYNNVETGEYGDYEPSFIVFNNGANTDFNKLLQYGMIWCAKYDQDCFLVKAPNNPAIYVDRNGNKVNSTESYEVYKNDPKQEFFTTLNSQDRDREQMKKGVIGRRWTHDIQF